METEQPPPPPTTTETTPQAAEIVENIDVADTADKQPETDLPGNDSFSSEKFRRIRDQICFYFSDSNLLYDRFMKKLLDLDEQQSGKEDNQEVKSDGTKPISLETFLKFNKISALTKTVDELKAAFCDGKAAKESLSRHHLEFDEKTNSIRRIKPFDPQECDATYRTLYLEGFDPEKCSDINENLRNCFREPDGPQILSVRVPKFDIQNGVRARFAFVELNDERSASKCCRLLERISKEINGFSTETETEDYENYKILKETLISMKHPDYKIRVLTKYDWNRYKNRYLRFQKKFRKSFWRNQMENLKESFNLQQPEIPSETICTNCQQQQQQRKRSINEVDDSSVSTKSNENDQPGGHIVRIELILPETSLINYINLWKTMKKIIQQGYEKDSTMPNPDDIAYIDSSQSNMIFQADGITRLPVFIRTNNSSGVEKYSNEKFLPFLRENLPNDFGTVDCVTILDEKEIGEYWRSVNQSKRIQHHGGKRFKNSYCS